MAAGRKCLQHEKRYLITYDGTEKYKNVRKIVGPRGPLPYSRDPAELILNLSNEKSDNSSLTCGNFFHGTNGIGSSVGAHNWSLCCAVQTHVCAPRQ